MDASIFTAWNWSLKCVTELRFSTWVLGIALMSSYLPNNHFTHGTIFPVPTLKSLNKIKAQRQLWDPSAWGCCTDVAMTSIPISGLLKTHHLVRSSHRMLRHGRNTQGALEGDVLPSSPEVTMTSPHSDLTAFECLQHIWSPWGTGAQHGLSSPKLLETHRVCDVPTPF